MEKSYHEKIKEAKDLQERVDVVYEIADLKPSITDQEMKSESSVSTTLTNKIQDESKT